MISSLICNSTMNPCFSSSQPPSATFVRNSSSPQNKFQIEVVNSMKMDRLSLNSPPFSHVMLQKSILPLAASIAVVFWSCPANAGFLSGSTGIESVPGPQLPQIDFLARFNEENQKKYAEADAKFKESPILKELLEKSKLNKDKNRQSTLDKYCLRGAEWGVGDCSTAGMTPEERDKFIAMLKQKAGVE